MHNHNDYFTKLCLIGDSAVGKSALLLRLTSNTFSQHYISTIGVDFGSRIFETNASIVKLQIWDTAVIEKYRAIISPYYKGAHGVIFVYDVTNRQSFKSIEYWLAQANKYGNLNFAKILVGNKSDLQATREVKPEEGKDLAEFLGIMFLETSAKEAVNVEKAFTILFKEIKLKGIIQKNG